MLGSGVVPSWRPVIAVHPSATSTPKAWKRNWISTENLRPAIAFPDNVRQTASRHPENPRPAIAFQASTSRLSSSPPQHRPVSRSKTFRHVTKFVEAQENLLKSLKNSKKLLTHWSHFQKAIEQFFKVKKKVLRSQSKLRILLTSLSNLREIIEKFVIFRKIIDKIIFNLNKR